MIEEASISVGDMPETLVFPLCPFAFELLVMLWFTLVALFLASSGEQQYKVNEDACPGNQGTDYGCRLQ